MCETSFKRHSTPAYSSPTPSMTVFSTGAVPVTILGAKMERTYCSRMDYEEDSKTGMMVPRGASGCIQTLLDFREFLKHLHCPGQYKFRTGTKGIAKPLR